MSEEAKKAFLSKIKKEIEGKIKTETKEIEKIREEHEELIRASNGYDAFYHELEHFITDSMQDFSVTEENLPKYFKSNINEVYQNYVQIKQDAFEEEETLKKYIDNCKRNIGTNKRSLKFYRSQYLDSDFFEECLPLVTIYQEKIDLYKENQEMTHNIIEKLRKIANKLSDWN
ncbi:hypothetical protein [Methanosphaera sp. WGK6]|uniref:hypothetical protein n=1 Tax=Methanosphaera sp. WGK6 TaxID=1561964 RepID=UPI00084C64E1|nr:hypothetical protein [Methanosphaera sp. WGK6]OED30184.1 hypothetical protein NL43_04645 [Methanosphaera sp. WGK6]